MSWLFCTSGSAIAKAGLNANTNVILSGSIMNAWSDQAEGTICAMTRRDWITGYSTTLSVPVAYALNNIASSMIAKQIITYDMSGYTNTQEAFTMLNVHDDIIKAGIKVLEDFKSNTLKIP